jgi:hypothetical protein
MMHRRGRFDRLDEIRRLDPVTDYHTIYRTTALYEFPFDVRMGLLLAFWRTFAVPSVAELLASTRETTDRTARRADDTGILMYTLIDHGLDDPLGRTATRRLNQIHRRFTISNDDYRYVLGTFIFAGSRWIDQHGWRPLCCHERAAMFTFYTTLGRRMNITDLPSTWDGYASFYDAYEAEHFAPSAAAGTLMTATKGLLANLPRRLQPAGLLIADALLDTPLREATGTPRPPWWARQLLASGLATRTLLLRHTLRPRADRYPGPSARTYPDGYDLATVGPDEPLVGGVRRRCPTLRGRP